MIKCLAIVCLLGLTVSAFDYESGSVGQRSNRMNMLSRHVGARMLAGTNGQGQDFQINSGFVPIPRANTMQSNNVIENTIGQQQLTPEQMQQLQSFLSSQQQSIAQQQSVQKPVTSQFQQPTQTQMSGQTFSGQQQFQQPMQQQQTVSQFGQQPQQQQVFRSSMDTGFNSFDNQQQQQQFTQGQGRIMQTPAVNSFGTGAGLSGMGLGTVSTTTTTTTTPIMPITSFMMAATTTPTVIASKPSPTEQQLLDQQIHIQKLKEQLFNMQQQQKQQLQQQQPSSTVVQTPSTSPSSSPSFVGTPSQQLQQQQQFQQSIQQSQALQQQQLMQQEQKQQQKISMQQQLQQQQLLDQINQLNQQKPAQQQQFSQFQQPVSANVSRMVTQVRPMPTQQPVQQQQMFVAPQQQQQMGRGVTDICAGRQDGELLPHPVDETQFIVCGSLGEITLMDCPNHTVFNPHLKLCDLTSEMPTLCKSNPCLNGAKCVELSPTQFQCECPAGFSGRTCEKFDTCSSAQPCGSDGVCLSFALGSPIPHVCLCNGGRAVGISCQQGEQNPCLMPGSATKLMPVNFNRAVFAHCEGARPHFKFCQPPLMFSAAKQSCEWSV